MTRTRRLWGRGRGLSRISWPFSVRVAVVRDRFHGLGSYGWFFYFTSSLNPLASVVFVHGLARLR
jgi:hypothetical protein